METKYDKDRMIETIAMIGSALVGVDLTRASIIRAKREYQMSNAERAMLDDLLIKLQMHEIYLTELKRTKERELKDLCK